MSVLISETGEVVTNVHQIIKQQRNFYQDLFTTDESVEFKCPDTEGIPRLTENYLAHLKMPITFAELTAILKSARREVSAGPDGLTYKFYIMNWKILRPLLFDAMIESFNEGEIFPSALKGMIVTIPKKKKTHDS